MRSAYFQDAVESSTKVIGRKAVAVVFEGDRAETDGNTVYLPAIPPSADITVDQQQVVRGYRDHEAMHVRCTNTNKETMQKLKDVTQNTPSMAKLVQISEDVRIEHAGVSEYAGMKTSFTAIQTHSAKMLVQELEQHGKPEDVVKALPRHIQLRLALQAMGRSKVGIGSDGIFEKLIDSMRTADPGLMKFADEWSDKIVALPTGHNGKALVEVTSRKGTAEAFALAEKLYKEFGELDAPPPPPPPPPNDKPTKTGDEDDDCKGDGKSKANGKGKSKPDGKGGGKTEGKDKDKEDEDEDDQPKPGDHGEDDDDSDDQGEDDDGSGAGAGAGGEDDDDEDDDAQDDQGSGEDAEGGADDDNGSGSDLNSSGNSMAALGDDAIDIDDLYKNALKDVIATVSGQKDYQKGGAYQRKFSVCSSAFSIMVPVLDAQMAMRGDYKGGAAARERYKKSGRVMVDRMDAELVGKKAMIRRLLELELQARADRRWESGFTSGRLQSIRLVQALQGRDTVYQQRTTGKDMDTLLYIGIDGSSSMSGSRMYESAKLSYALAEALERTGCDVIITAWSNLLLPKAKYPASTYTETEFNEMRYRLNRSQNGVMQAGLGVLTRVMIKPKNQRTTSPEARHSIGLGASHLNSSTPTYQAIFEDLRDIGRERHAKKIYLHITDGQPDGTLNGATMESIMQEAHQFAKTVGVHMIGVGISGMNVSHMFEDFVNVSGSDAYEPVIKKLAKLVAKEAGHAAGFKRAA